MNNTMMQGTRVLTLVLVVLLSAPRVTLPAEPTLPAIAAQPLDKALQQLARLSELQIAYVASVSAGLFTGGCPAGLTPVEALKRLLDGTGLTFEMINERMVRVRPGGSGGLNKAPVLSRQAPRPQPPQGYLKEIVVVGSRSDTARTSTETLMPVDIVSSAELADTEQTDLMQMLNFVVPSFNSTRQTIADGTDHIDPATLRGLGPDQVLVLINGKRQHTTALVNVNSTIGRGSVGYDMNAVPTGAIERVEVLRDGAAAQYGSDAIAGVINIVLQEGAAPLKVTNVYSQTQEHDGQTAVGSVSYGAPIGDAGGFINGTLQYSDRNATDRSGTYDNTVYLPPLEQSRYFVPLAPEDLARQQQDEALVQQRGFDRNAMVVGNASSRSYRAFFNSAAPVSREVDVYSFGGYERRHGRAAGFYRYPNSISTQNLTVYPDGYLPFIETDIDNLTLALGMKREPDEGWKLELSNKYGFNTIAFEVDNSLNPSLGALSPRHFYCGELSFAQDTINLDVSRRLQSWLVRSFNMAFGAEYRIDRYGIGAGEEASWRDYNPPGTPASQAMAAGAEVFSGFRPDDEVTATRASLGLYADFESDINERLLLGAAARVEQYSDFGSNLSGKLAGRFELTDDFAIRGGISRGFRAPSLHQKFYSAISTQFITVDGVNQQRRVVTVRNDTEIARALGIAELGPETSLSYSLGLASDLRNGLTFTIDAYQIDIDDRIVMSGRISDSQPQLASYLRDTDVTDAQFFTNAVDTRTRGVDAILIYRHRLRNAHKFGVNAAFNYNEMDIRRLRTPPQLAGWGEQLLNREECGRLELNQPRDKLILSLSYGTERTEFHLQTTRFGEITTVAPQDPAQDQTFSAKFVTDAAITYKHNDHLQLTIGANNLFDVYPDKVADPRLTNDATVPYSRFATQFGFNGATYFAKFEFAN